MTETESTANSRVAAALRERNEALERLKVAEADAKYVREAVDGICYYRNLAIGLGAKPEQMLGPSDKKLCEDGIDLTEDCPDYFCMRDQLAEIGGQWEHIEKLEAEIQRLRNELCLISASNN